MGTSKLRILMAQRDIRAQELCHMAKVSKTTISRLMNGMSRPTYDVACRIADALGVKIDKIFDNF